MGDRIEMKVSLCKIETLGTRGVENNAKSEKF